MFRIILARGAVVTGAAMATILGTAVAASASQPNITSVSFSGPSGPSVPSPTVTITGSGFGAAAPKGTSDNSTSCGPYTANGDVYGTRLYFLDDANFEAGYSDSSGANCIGIIVVSWSPAKVVLKFGNAYGTFRPLVPRQRRRIRPLDQKRPLGRHRQRAQLTVSPVIVPGGAGAGRHPRQPPVPPTTVAGQPGGVR